MSVYNHLAHASIELVKAMDKMSDESLPKEISDVVKLHAKLAVGSSLIPVPGADIAAGAANIWTMYLRINSKIGMKIGENILKTIASAVLTNLAGYVAVLSVGSAMKFIPGLGTLGSIAIMSGALYAVTLASGYVYLKALTAMVKNGYNIDEQKLKESVNNYMNSNSSEIKDFINAAKKDYKKENN